MTEEEGFCYQVFHPLAQEFRKDNFGLDHQPVDDFCKSQWQRGRTSYCWLIYRWCFAVAFTTGVIISLPEFGDKWFIYLTNWGSSLCMFTSIYGAVLVSIYHCKPDKLPDGSRLLKLYWMSHWSSLALAILISFEFWAYASLPHVSVPINTYRIWSHGFNSILMILDHMLVAFPTRILHFIYPLTIGLLYALFSFIYYLAGGLDIRGEDYIYEALDYKRYPVLAVSYICLGIVLLFLFSIVLFILYKFRCFIYHKCSHTAHNA